MSTGTEWTPLDLELDRWQAAGRQARFWLRDDDAVEPTPALERLLDLGAMHGAPLALAVIPAPTGEALAEFLAGRNDIGVCVHGWSHRNHAGPGEKKQELGLHRPRAEMLAELASGFGKLQRLHGPRFAPVLVPPWNRIAAPLLPELAPLGYRALSVFGPEGRAELPLFNTHVDLMDWHGTRGGRPTAALVADIVRRLQQMFDTGGALGFLTHHLVHDEAAWGFTAALMRRIAQHPGSRWVALADMLAER